ncbi:MAG: PQQ-binding-like beta-propeller repeat protein [bacterium]
MKKNIFLTFCFVLLIPVFSATASDQGFSLPSKKAFKTQNLTLLSPSWTTALKQGAPAKRYYPETNNPTLKDGIVYIGTHAGLFYAVNLSGRVLWEHENPEGIASTASVSNSSVFFTDLGGHLICLNKIDGTQKWKRSLNTEALDKPLLVDNKIYLVSGEQTIFALSQTDGQTVWKKQLNTHIKKLTIRGQAEIVAEQAALYVGLADGLLYKLNSINGNTLWSKNLNVPLSTFKDIDASVVLSGDSIYVGGYFGKFYRLNKSNGNIVWSTDITTGVSALVLDALVVVSDTNGAVHGLEKTTGRPLWFTELGTSVVSTPTLFQDMIFVTVFDKNAYLLDAASGHQVQKLVVSKGSLNKPVVLDNKVLVYTNDAKLVLLTEK